MDDDNFPNLKPDTEPQPRPLWALLWAIAWLAVAGAMAIWPYALRSADNSCVYDEDAFILCFITTSWGNPIGIVISLIFGLTALWNFLRPGTRAED